MLGVFAPPSSLYNQHHRLPSCHVFVHFSTSSLLSTGAIAITNGLYGDPAVQQVIGDVRCIGTEPSLLGCSYTVFGVNQPAHCDPSIGDAAAVCQGMVSVQGKAGDLR